MVIKRVRITPTSPPWPPRALIAPTSAVHRFPAPPSQLQPAHMAKENDTDATLYSPEVLDLPRPRDDDIPGD